MLDSSMINDKNRGSEDGALPSVDPVDPVPAPVDEVPAVVPDEVVAADD